MPATLDLVALERMSRRLRRLSIEAVAAAGSGHPTSCLSAAEIVATLFFHEMRFDPRRPELREADHFVLSKGHAAPLLWAALREAGAIHDDPRTLRRFDSPLEGHPTPRCPWVRVATGALGQGLSAAAGMALGRRLDRAPGRIYCLLGDGEAAEGAVWEAAAFAGHLRLANLCAIVDVNRLGQSGPTRYGHDLAPYAAQFAAFGWSALRVDGHSVPELAEAFARARAELKRPTVILARTLKGKGVSFLEDRDGLHGRPVDPRRLDEALAELDGDEVAIRIESRGYPSAPELPAASGEVPPLAYRPGERVATREAYGAALARLGMRDPRIVVLDGDVKNSTFADRFQKAFPDRFVEGFVAEQNMVGAALGLSAEGKIPCVSTFACFIARAFDFIRMAAYSRPRHLVLCGSHAGLSVGEDGPSQMGLEDLALMRAVFGSTVFYPSDAASAERLVELAAETGGLVYLRMTRPKVPVLYGPQERFVRGGAKLLRSSSADRAAVVAAGITVHQALAAHELLARQGVPVRVIDAYSIKPLDETLLARAAGDCGLVLTVEDHAAQGGLGEAVCAALPGRRVRVLAVREIPRSGRADELLAWAGIDAAAIAAAVRESLR